MIWERVKSLFSVIKLLCFHKTRKVCMNSKNQKNAINKTIVLNLSSDTSGSIGLVWCVVYARHGVHCMFRTKASVRSQDAQWTSPIRTPQILYAFDVLDITPSEIAYGYCPPHFYSVMPRGTRTKAAGGTFLED